MHLSAFDLGQIQITKLKDDSRITHIINEINAKAELRKSRAQAISLRGGSDALRNQTWVQGMRSTFNEKRFGYELPTEAIYAEVVLG